MPIPVIDLFAGPGGLGEGFSREKAVRFDIAVSIEKDGMAHETLRLRAAHRALTRNVSATINTWRRWDEILRAAPWNIAFTLLCESGDEHIASACARAEHEALHFELDPTNRRQASKEIRDRLAPFMKANQLPRNCVLIGGPPCQAYSIVGRARNRGTDGYSPERDPRHFLYLEYLHVIAEFRPAVFVMENVKGILTSRVHDRHIFHTILRDLKRPDVAAKTSVPVEYVLLPLPAREGLFDDPAPDDFIVKAEEYGVPQARHRVIILGIRKDVFEAAKTVRKLVRTAPRSVWDVIGDLPALRPELSFRGRGMSWLDALGTPLFDNAIKELRRSQGTVAVAVAERLVAVREKLLRRRSDPGCGEARVHLGAADRRRRPKQLAAWYRDRPSDLLANHESRSHMPSDLVRYLFVAAFGEVTQTSPRLVDFPKALLPDHRNVDHDNVAASIFKDRFRVQVGSRYGMTVTSHIAKDGHAFIHPKASQCRSLTVREAARLQTFPDTYIFLGNRTSQYSQVGNAVPPFLARQIAGVVGDLLLRAGLA
jgi:DNA (cytosine-5)-methyltransferase 1